MTETIVNTDNILPLKYGFFRKNYDIFVFEQWLCEDFIVNFRKPVMSNLKVEKKNEFLPATHAILTLHRNKSDGFICEEKILSIGKMPEPMHRKRSGEIVLPIDILVQNKSALYEFLSDSLNMTDNLKIRSQIRNYILFNNYINQKRDMPKIYKTANYTPKTKTDAG